MKVLARQDAGSTDLGSRPANSSRAAEVAVVLVTHNSAGFIGQCLSSLVPSGADLIVVDNGSTDETRQIIGRYPHVRLIETGGNLGYGKAINRGAAEAGPHCKYLILSNADVVYGQHTVSTLISFLESHREIGITAPRQISPSGGWQRSYGDVPGIWAGVKDAFGISSAIRWYRRLCWPRRVDSRPKEVGYVSGAVLALPRVAYLQAKGFDEDFYFYGEESDLCVRLRQMGWKVVFCPLTEVAHYGGGHSTCVDQSDRFYRFLATSDVMLAKRHLSRWRARIYLWLKRIYFLELALAFRIVSVFAPTNKTAHLSRKIWVVETCAKLWTEQLSALKDNSGSKPGSQGLG